MEKKCFKHWCQTLILRMSICFNSGDNTYYCLMQLDIFRKDITDLPNPLSKYNFYKYYYLSLKDTFSNIYDQVTLFA